MNINNILLPNEQILYKGVADSKKVNKNIGGLILITVFCLILFLAFLNMSEFSFGAFIGIIIVFGVAIYSFIYNLFLKGNKVSGQYYFITNKRAIIYSSKKNEYIIGYLNRFDEFRVDNEKDNFGDVYMGIAPKKSGDVNQDLSTVANNLFNKDKSDMPIIIFEAVENPYQVLKIAKSERINLAPEKKLFNDSKDGQHKVKIGGMRVTVYDNPIWVKFIYVVGVILLLAFPIYNMINTLKIWTSYKKTTATIVSVEKKVARDIKYFVDISYVVGSDNYEGLITNDKCYLKSTQNFTGSTTNCRKYDKKFRKMKINDKIYVYVNPNNPVDVEFVPTLIDGSNLILLLFGLLCSVGVIAMIKVNIEKRKKH